MRDGEQSKSAKSIAIPKNRLLAPPGLIAASPWAYSRLIEEEEDYRL